MHSGSKGSLRLKTGYDIVLAKLWDIAVISNQYKLKIITCNTNLRVWQEWCYTLSNLALDQPSIIIIISVVIEEWLRQTGWLVHTKRLILISTGRNIFLTNYAPRGSSQAIDIGNMLFIIVPSHTSILPIHVWVVPYAYGQPIWVWAAHVRVSDLYVCGLSIHIRTVPYRYRRNPCFAYMRMSACMSISISYHQHKHIQPVNHRGVTRRGF